MEIVTPFIRDMTRYCPKCCKSISPLSFLGAALKGKTFPEAPGVVICPHCKAVIGAAILHQSWVTWFSYLAGAVTTAFAIYPHQEPMVALVSLAALVAAIAGAFWLLLYNKTHLSLAPRIFLAVENGNLLIQSRGYPLPTDVSEPSRFVHLLNPAEIERIRINDGYMAVYLKPSAAAIDVFFQPALQHRVIEMLTQQLPMLQVEQGPLK